METPTNSYTEERLWNDPYDDTAWEADPIDVLAKQPSLITRDVLKRVIESNAFSQKQIEKLTKAVIANELTR
jgi:hypothetical protein